MADEADCAQEKNAAAEAARIAKIRVAAANIPVGTPGDCDLCGEHSMRLVGAACACCRDKYKLG